MNPFNERQTATILAALRYWQRRGSSEAIDEQEIATDAGTVDKLNVEEIDTLCEDINIGDAANRDAGATIASVLNELEALRDTSSEDPDTDSIFLHGFFTLSTYNHARELVGLRRIEYSPKPVETGPVMQEATEILRACGIRASYEHPGYIAVITEGDTASFGSVNGDYGGEWLSSGGAAGLVELPFHLPRSATASQLADAIKTWFKAVL
jgi:hypothetical protein